MTELKVDSLWEDIEKIRRQAPLVHNITNYVVMNTTANALLAIGASPVMAHAIGEVEEMVGLASALVINIGTLSEPWIDAMLRAGSEAGRRGIPVVLDPVGVGATTLRTETARKLLQTIRPAVVRGNGSEIHALAMAGGITKGVDSTMGAEAAVAAAAELSAEYKCVVAISGATDVIINRDQRIDIRGGHPMMARVTGLGCTASALTGAFAAVNPDAFPAAAHAMAVMGIAGLMAAEKSAGPGSLQLYLLDILYGIQRSDIADHLDWEFHV